MKRLALQARVCHPALCALGCSVIKDQPHHYWPFSLENLELPLPRQPSKRQPSSSTTHLRSLLRAPAGRLQHRQRPAEELTEQPCVLMSMGLLIGKEAFCWQRKNYQNSRGLPLPTKGSVGAKKPAMRHQRRKNPVLDGNNRAN